MLKRNFILLSLVAIVLIIFTSFDDEVVDVDPLPSNKNTDLSIISEIIGPELSLSGENYVIVNLWATWCTPCIEEVGYLQQLSSLEDFIVIGLLVDDSESNGLEFIDEYNLSYLNILSEDKVELIITQFFWSGLPTTLLLNDDLIVLETFNGPITYEMIIDYVN